MKDRQWVKWEQKKAGFVLCCCCFSDGKVATGLFSDPV